MGFTVKRIVQRSMDCRGASPSQPPRPIGFLWWSKRASQRIDGCCDRAGLASLARAAQSNASQSCLATPWSVTSVSKTNL